MDQMTRQILLIPDETADLSALAAHLNTSVFDLTIADDAKEGIAYLSSNSYDILIANPLTTDTLNQALLSAKAFHPDLEMILYAPAEKIDLIAEQFKARIFACHSVPLNEQTLGISIAQAAKKIALKSENRRYADELLEVSTGKALLDQLFDEVPCYISVQDKDLKIIKVNNRFKTRFGEHIGEYCYEVYKSRTEPCEVCPVVETFKDGKSHRTEENVISQSGKQYDVLTLTSPITDENGKIDRVMELSVNITQIRQFQDHMASLGLMLGSMFHGVKGTLTALDGGVYQLETGIAQKDLAKAAQAHDQIKAMVEKIKKMVVEILDYAKSRELNYEIVDLDSFLNNVEETCRPAAEKAGVEFKIDLSDKPCRMEVDAGWLEAALVNFLENAFDACEADLCQKTHKVELTITRPEVDQICFSISDDGIGMTPEIKDKLFTLFFTSKGPKGTGLGMFIANRVIRYHGGRITFSSKEGRGTRFDILLPIEKPEKNTERPSDMSRFSSDSVE